MEKKLFDYAVGEELQLPVLIKSADIRQTKTNKPYIAFTFQDTSGQIDAKLWDANPKALEMLTAGKVVMLKGLREVYNNTPQIKIYNLTIIEHGNPSDFIERVELSAKEIEEDINLALFWITDGTIARITRHIYQKYKTQFYDFPAAKRHHHAVVGGLSFHTLSMLRIGDHLMKLYPQINRSLLTAGILLHDIGKVLELSGSVGTEYTLSGKLVGHIVMMSDEITKACQELNIDETLESVIVLKHMILAHHGKLEYGSPVAPQLLEAEMLHHIDLIDATANMLIGALDKTAIGEFSDKIYGLDNRMFYKHGIQ